MTPPGLDPAPALSWPARLYLSLSLQLSSDSVPGSVDLDAD